MKRTKTILKGKHQPKIREKKDSIKEKMNTPLYKTKLRKADSNVKLNELIQKAEGAKKTST